MSSIALKTLILIFIILTSLSKAAVFAKVRVRVMNRMGRGKSMNVHCQSKDDDLGYHVVPYGFETDWVFSVNFWGTTLFFCDVQLEDTKWHHFDAYSYTRDADRCQTECIWVVANDGHLYNYNQAYGNWGLVPFP